MLDVGTPAPDFAGVDQGGKPFQLSSLRGRWVVLYFYPKDETPGCAAEACAFRDNFQGLQQMGAEVVGISVQDEESHRRFTERHNLNFRLIADPDKRITGLYGTLGLLGMAKRVTYLVDPDGRIRDVYRSELDPKSHVDRAQTRLREMAAPSPGAQNPQSVPPPPRSR